MERHADTYSQAFSLKDYKLLQEGKVAKKDLWRYSSYWYKNFDEMAEKTMIRQLISKWGIMSIEMETAYERDMAVVDEGGATRYIDNEPVVIDDEIQANANSEAFEMPDIKGEPEPEAKPQEFDPGF